MKITEVYGGASISGQSVHSCLRHILACQWHRRAPYSAKPVGLVARGFNRFSSERTEWYNRSASGLYGWVLTDLCSVHDLLCSLHYLMEEPALLGRPDSTGPGKTIVAKRTVKGPRGAIAAMVYASQINADLHIRFFPAATIAYCHELILSTVRVRTPKLDAEQDHPNCSLQQRLDALCPARNLDRALKATLNLCFAIKCDSR